MQAKDYSADLHNALEKARSSLDHGHRLEVFWMILGLKMFLDHVPDPRRYERFTNPVSELYLQTRDRFDEIRLADKYDYLHRLFASEGPLLPDEYELILSLMVDVAQAEIYAGLSARSVEQATMVRVGFEAFMDSPHNNRQILRAENLFKRNNFTLEVIDQLTAYVMAPLLYSGQGQN